MLLLARLARDIGNGCRGVGKEKLRVEAENKEQWDRERGEVRRFEGAHNGPPASCGEASVLDPRSEHIITGIKNFGPGNVLCLSNTTVVYLTLPIL